MTYHNDLDEQAAVMLREAFKRSLRQHIGSKEMKPIWELQTWSLALLELATEFREDQLRAEDELQLHAYNQPKIDAQADFGWVTDG